MPQAGLVDDTSPVLLLLKMLMLWNKFCTSIKLMTWMSCQHELPWAGGMRKSFDFSLLDVFQERHAAEVRRNKELQVELSGWKQQWWMWPIPTISKLPLPILLWIMRYKYGKCMMWFKKKIKIKNSIKNFKKETKKIKTKTMRSLCRMICLMFKKLGSYFVNTYIFVKKYNYCIMQVIS